MILRGGRLRPLPDGMADMTPTRIVPLAPGDPFTIGGTARMALETCIPPRRAEQDETIANFVKRRLGREAYDRLVEPLLGASTPATPVSSG